MLNYHHLRIFWTVAREGGLRQAAERLHLTQPTLSMQINQLEDSLGQPLFMRAGRKMILTEAGRVTMQYAEEIFSLGREMVRALEGGSEVGTRRLHVGIVDSLPKLVARDMLRPVLTLTPAVRVICHEGSLDELARRLAQHHLDVLLTDEPLSGENKLGTFNHRLGASRLAFCGTRELVKTYRSRFPQSLHLAPMLLPTPCTPMRRLIDAWFASEKIEPVIVAEFDDTALLKDFAAEGFGIAPIHETALAQVGSIYGLGLIGLLKEVTAEFYAISPERKLRNEAVVLITQKGSASLEKLWEKRA